MNELFAPEFIVLAILLLSLSLYGVLGGADFGAGVWEFTTVLQSDPDDRRLIHRAIGPVWEANHVWLIFVLIIMFNGFPTAFAAVAKILWLPLLFALAGIVFRGAGYIFRAYAVGSNTLKVVWGAAFAFASTATPFFLGAAVGAVSSAEFAVTADGDFSGNYANDWLTPLSIYSGVLAVGMCAYLAAVYLTHEAQRNVNHIPSQDKSALVFVWRSRALGTGIWIGILAWLGLIMCYLEAPTLWDGLRQRGWPLIAISFLAGTGSLAALRREEYRFANLMAAAAVAMVILGWGLGQYPYLVPPHITIHSSKSPPVVLWAMIATISVGAVFLFPALWWLMRLFKGEATSPDRSRTGPP